MQSVQEKNTLKYYNTLETLPIGCFFKIIKTGDIRYLIKLDDYFELPECSLIDLLDLKNVWEKISMEYINLSKKTNKQTEISFWLEREILNLKTDYVYSEWLIYLIERGIEVEKSIAELNFIGIDIKDGTKEQVEYARNRRGLILNKIKIKRAELKRNNSDDNEDKKESSFEDLIAQIERFQGVYIDIWKITVRQWLSYVNQYEQYCKELEHGRRQDKQR